MPMNHLTALIHKNDKQVQSVKCYLLPATIVIKEKEGRNTVLRGKNTTTCASAIPRLHYQ